MSTITLPKDHPTHAHPAPRRRHRRTRRTAPLIDTVLTALHDGAALRNGPLPAGGPDTVTPRTRTATHPLIPDHGTGPHHALRALVTALAEGAADPAHPHCAAHLHTPPLALAAAADLAASALNPSMDSWDQAPAATALEADLTTALAAEIYPHTPSPDAVITTGGTEANQLALLLARERHGPVQAVCATTAHHSIARAAWLLGLPQPVTVPAPDGTMDPAALDATLTRIGPPLLVVATAGTTDTGQIDPLDTIADLCTTHGAELHIDAAYGGPLLLSPTHRALLHGLDRAQSVTLDLHKLGWQPASAGLFAVPDRHHLTPSTTTPPTSTPTTTPKRASPTSSAAPSAPPAAPTPSRSPSPSRPSAAPDSPP